MGSKLYSLISELHSIESVLDDVFQPHSLLLSRLGVLPQDVSSSAESLENSDLSICCPASLLGTRCEKESLFFLQAPNIAAVFLVYVNG